MFSNLLNQKCLNSIQKYPLPLNTGKECIILEGFGDKICKLIDEKLRPFLDDGGVLHEEEFVQDLDSDAEEVVSTKKTSKKTFKYKSCQAANDDDEIATIEIESESCSSKYKSSTFAFSTNQTKKSTISSSSTSKQADEPADKCNRKNKKKYVPEIRSGPYALLVALFNNESNSQVNIF